MFGLFRKYFSVIGSGLLEGAVDNHSHLIPGVDDGVSTLEESLDILAMLEENGVKKVWFTPHIMEDVRNTTDDLRRRYDKLLEAYQGKMMTALSAEYMMDSVFEERLKTGDLLTHGGGTVLVETSTWAPPLRFWELISEMQNRGYRPILAHPERYRYMRDSDYDRLVANKVILQVNLPSLVGFYGDDVQAKAETFIKKGWVSMIGSDCHSERRIKYQYNVKELEKSIIERLKPIMTADAG